jgi:5'-nucleotidase
MKSKLLVLSATALLAACAGLPTPTPDRKSTEPLTVKILAINDFHGNLMPPSAGIRIPDPKDPTKTQTVKAGGAEHMATAVKQLRGTNANTIFVGAGDLIGASPLLSALFHDEPTVESLGLMNLEVAAVGNHEFDHGKDELLRLQHGGCHPRDGCTGPAPFRGASFKYLAASTIDTKTGKTILPPYYIKTFEGVPIGFIGLTLKNTPGIVSPSGVAGLHFADEAETVNALIPELKRQGVNAIVALIHEGGFPTGGYNECPGISGPIVNIVKRLDKAVSVVVSGHTHKAYNCDIDGRLVTSGDKYGTLVTDIDLKLDRAAGTVTSAKANNVIVRIDAFAKDPDQTKLINAYTIRSNDIAKRPVASIAASLTRDESPAGETNIGNLVADAQLHATREPAHGGAVIALTNIGGIRAPLMKVGAGGVSYADVFAVQPFYNNLLTVTLTGQQILTALEQQWLNQPKPRPLQVSHTFKYTWDATRPVGERVVPGSVTINGAPLSPSAEYRVTINSFLAEGGDGFSVFKSGKNALTGPTDLGALDDYMRQAKVIMPPALDRIRRLN